MAKEGDDKLKTVLDDNAAIYGKRDEGNEWERFKSLEGKAKWDFFKDYYLGRCAAIIVIAAVVIAIAVTMLKPKQEAVLYIGAIDNPFPEEVYQKILGDLTDMLVTEPKTQCITFDRDLYFATDEYNSRMKLMTLIAAGDMDCLILPEKEAYNYGPSGALLGLEELYGSEAAVLDIFKDKAVKMKFENGTGLDRDEGDEVEYFEGYYAIDISDYICKTCGYESLNSRYFLICVSNTKHQENFKIFADYLIGK